MDIISDIPLDVEDAVVASAYIRSEALARLLSAIPSQAPIDIFVRWKPGDIASGASDLAVWQLVTARGNCRLFTCPQLHAKYYRFNRRLWVGSANLTMRGMGWGRLPNIEILEEIPWTTRWAEWERLLRNTSVEVTQDMVDQLATFEVSAETGSDQRRPDYSTYQWIPSTRDPDRFMDVALGRSIPAAIRQDALDDLNWLGLSVGAPAGVVRQTVRRAISLSPIFLTIERTASQGHGQRFGVVRAQVAQLLQELGSQADPSATTQVAYRWLLAFLPDRYELVSFGYSEVLRLRAPETRS